MKYIKIIIVFFLFSVKGNAQFSSEYTDRLDGYLPHNYISVEGAFTSGFSAAAGIDAYIDVLRMFDMKKTPSLVLTGQYFVFSGPKHQEKLYYDYGHHFGINGQSYKVGAGIILFEYKSSMKFKFYYDKSTAAESKVVSRLYEGPVSKSIGIFVNYIHDNSGSGWTTDTINGPGNYKLLPGSNNYIVPTVKIQKAWNFLKSGINPDGQKGWRYFDIGIPFTKDLKQMGVRFEWFFLAGIWTSRLSVGAIYRKDVPDDPDKNRKAALHWYFPITVTIGIGTNVLKTSQGDKRYSEKVNKNKSLL